MSASLEERTTKAAHPVAAELRLPSGIEINMTAFIHLKKNTIISISKCQPCW